MTTSAKFDRASAVNSFVSIADSPNLTIAAGEDFAIAIGLLFDGPVAGYGTQLQTLYHTGSYRQAGGMVAYWRPIDASSNPGKFYFELDGTGSLNCYVGPVEANRAYILVLQRSAGVINSKLCPVRTAAPVDGSSVLTGVPLNYNAAFDAPMALSLGYSQSSGRRLGQSATRFFKINRPLTDLEIETLAYGKEISSITTPQIYIRMHGADDVSDIGSQGNVVTSNGLVTGGEFPFGFDSTPTAPIITSKPVINGSPVVGGATSYTPSPATGNPSPTTSQQWQIAGSDNVFADIAGATAATYTPVAGDAGKRLRVRQIESNGVNPDDSEVSDPVAVSSVIVALSPTEQRAESINQQINGVGLVPVEVAYTGTVPAKLEFQLYDADGTTITKPWADTGLAPSNGKFLGNVAMPTHTRKNRIAYRSKNASGDVMANTPVLANKFGIGDVYMGIGSSSMDAWFGSGSGANQIVDHNLVSTNGSDSTNPVFALFDTNGQAGQMAMHFATQFGYPVAFINRGISGSSLAAWADKTGTLFAIFIKWVNYVGGKIGGVFSTCGSNDITGSSAAASVADHLAKLRALAANVREVTGQPALPILHSGINRRTNANSDIQADNARAAEAIFGDDANNMHVQTLDFVLSTDGTHLTGGGYIGCTQRVRYVWAENKKFGIYRRGPKIQSFRFNGDKVNVELLHRSGADFTPTTGIAGFVVTDEKTDGVFTPVAILSCTRTNANNILITCDQALVKPKITYMAGMNPDYPAAVFDNGPQALPMVAEPFMVATAGAIETPKVLVPYYNDWTFTREIQSGGGSTPTDPPEEPPVEEGSLTTYQMHSSGTLRRNLAFMATWFKDGVIGEHMDDETHVSGVTDEDGRGVLTPLPIGVGLALIEFEDGGVFLQRGTVS